MKTSIFRKRLSALFAFFFCVVYSQAVTEIYVPAYGQLSTVLPSTELDSLIITGFLNSNDIAYIRNSMPNIAYLDLSKVEVQNNSLPNSAFDGKTSLRAFIFPETLTTIGYYSFRNTSLEAVALPETLTSINTYVFYGCTSLVSISIPEGLTSIPEYTFYGASALKSITLPSTVTGIGSHSFYACSSLKSIVFSENIETIGHRTFEGCTSLEAVALPAKLTSLNTYVFNGCSSLASVSIPEGLTSIPEYTFYDASALKSITLPSTVTAIGNYAFRYCSSLQSVVFSENIETIGTYAFQYCTSLKTLSLPAKLTSIGNYAFQYCSTLSDELLLPASLTNIGYQSFESCYKFTTCKTLAVTPPTLYDGSSLGLLTTIYVPQAALADYKQANIWSGKILIGDAPTSITLNITTPGTLGEKILEQFQYLNEVNILKVSGTLNSVDFNRIKDMVSLISVDLSGLTNEELPAEVFSGRTGLRDVKLPSNLKKIGNNCFYNCYALLQPEFPACLEEIGSYAFYACVNLRDELRLPASLKIIHSYAFRYCYNITSVHSPELLTTIESYAFGNCSGLKEFIFPDGLTGIGSYAFINCTALTEVTIPDKITTIEYETFENCTSLANVHFPESLTTIGGYAFYNCTSLTRLILPARLTNIDSYYHPWLNCSGLQQIICMQPTPPVLSYDAFSGVNKSTCELIVPFWAETDYKLANNWKLFEKISTYSEEIPFISVNGSLVFTNGVRPLGLPDIEITSTGNLTIRGNTVFNTKEFTLTPRFDRVYNSNSAYAQLLSECISMSAQKVKIDMSATGNRWYYLSFPFDVAVNDITIDADAYYVFRKYDGAARASQGAGNSWKDLLPGDTLRVGSGYIFQCSKNISHLVLPATDASRNNLFKSSAQVIPLDEHPSENTANSGWNLTGNPFASYYDIRLLDYTAPITIWNDYNNRYDALSPIDDAFLLSPYQAFFVQKPNDLNTVSFNPEGRQTTTEIVQRAPALRSSGERTLINLEISSGDAADKTRVVVNSEAQTDYELNRDAAKFMSTDVSVPQLYSLDASASYAINERPLDTGIIPLGYYAGKAGNYTVSLAGKSGDLSVALKDKLRDVTTDLNTGGYIFNSETGVFNNRFELILSKSPTDIQTADLPIAKVYASNGNIIIEAASGKAVSVYAIGGAKILETTTTDATLSVPVVQGVYIVKVDNEVFKTVVF